MKEKTYVEDVDRSMYDFRNEDKDAYKVKEGLNPEIVEQISSEKHDPEWMKEFRMKSLEIFNNSTMPDEWGPSIEGLDMDNIVTYVRPNTHMAAKWSEVPEEIKDTFEKLGIPKAERESLAGVGAQYDSELVYHNVKEEVAAQGVIYTDMESALNGEYADMVHKHFMKLVPPTDHKFAALHGAVWSGGSFVYVPKGVSVTIPLQSYFRLNAPGAGQFEHTLIIVDEGAYLHFIEGCSAPKYNVANLHAGCVELFVGKNATLRYSTIENWSKNMYNLNTKRAKVEEGGKIEWVSGSFGSHVSYLYPMSILNGEGASAEFTGITFAGKGQNLDTGTKVVHNAPNTSSYVNTKSISKDGGVSTFRSSVVVNSKAKHSKSAVSCQSLMLDDISRSDTIPAMDIRTKDANIALCQVAIQCPDAIMKTETSEEQLNQIRTGMGEDMTKLLQESGTQAICFTAEEGVKEAAPVTLSFGYQDTDRKGNRIDLYLKENSEMTVVMDYHSNEGTGTAAIQTKIHAEKNAKLKLIQIERLGEGFDCMNDIGAYCEDGAGVELVQLIIGGKNVYMGAETTLAGKESDFTAAIGYQVTGENRLDMNYNAVHEGKKTTSSMTANGVLRDHAKKLFRGTIDFKKGAKGAKGDELEDVLLLDDGVQNQTIPLILCAEEDVEGNHGASIGSLDDELIFYLESRGISEEAAYELMANARLKAVCKKIPVEGLRAELNEMLDGEEPVGEEQ